MNFLSRLPVQVSLAARASTLSPLTQAAWGSGRRNLSGKQLDSNTTYTVLVKTNSEQASTGQKDQAVKLPASTMKDILKKSEEYALSGEISKFTLEGTTITCYVESMLSSKTAKLIKDSGSELQQATNDVIDDANLSAAKGDAAKRKQSKQPASS